MRAPRTSSNMMNGSQRYTANEIAFVYWANRIRQPKLTFRKLGIILQRTTTATIMACNDYNVYVTTGVLKNQNKRALYQSVDMLLAQIRTDKLPTLIESWEGKIEKNSPGEIQFERIPVEQEKAEIEPVEQPKEESFPLLSVTLNVRMDVLRNVIRIIRGEEK